MTSSIRPLIAGNWKMNGLNASMAEFDAMLAGADAIKAKADLLVCPPATLISAFADKAKGNATLAIGAQDCHVKASGAHTGDLSAEMLADAGATYIIVGHSERREIFGETDELCAKKVRAVLDWGMNPILCVGERLEEREQGQTQEKVARQVRAVLGGISSTEGERLVIAYEPIWAIGTGKNDSPPEANKTIGYIRSLLAESLGELAARKIRILGVAMGNCPDSLDRTTDSAHTVRCTARTPASLVWPVQKGSRGQRLKHSRCAALGIFSPFFSTEP